MLSNRERLSLADEWSCCALNLLRMYGARLRLGHAVRRTKGGEQEQPQRGAKRGMHQQQGGMAGDGSRELPLFYDGKERARFAYAVFCLSKVRHQGC